MEKLRVLQIADISCGSGVANFVMNNYRLMNHDEIVYDFVIWREEIGPTFRKEIEEKGGKIYPVASYRKHPWKQYRQIKKLIKQNGYQVLHAHESVVSAIALLAAKRCNVKVRVCHSHSTSMSNILKNTITRLASWFIGRSATELCACSEEAALFLFPHRKVLKGQYHLIPNAISIPECKFVEEIRNETRRELGIVNSKIIGHIGRFAVEKNHQWLLKILSELVSEDKSWKLMLIGDGELRIQIETQAEVLQIRDHILFLGFKEKAYRYLNAMDVLVFPSLFEGMPITLIEAQCNGLPCVISDTINSKIAITPLVTSLSLNSDCKHWAKKIKLVSQKGHGDYCSSIVSNGYDLNQSSQKLTRMYKQMRRK